MAEEIHYFILIISVLLVPKIVMRFQVPAGLTALVMGVLTSYYLGWFATSQTVTILATLGITSLFLFAGIEIDFGELKKNGPVLIKHILVSGSIITICTYVLGWILNLDTREAVVLSLGLTTPSTGFILNSIDNFKFTEEQRYWIRSKAIANEILALLILFFTLRSQSFAQLGISLAAIILMIILLPIAFRLFIKTIAPFARDSEVTFMILMAFICGVVTMKLGTYYLIGAFITGVVAAQFRHFIKTENSEKMLYS
ncbi:MAG: cation:proton antiporter, partial [Bdellovibrionales bacterium]|nr:cation:proton antiporter [Bdellovibrionales bacterium]